MNFIINLLLNKRKNYVYDSIFVIINKYIKMMRYLSIIKKINIMKLLDLFYKKIILKFDIFNDIIINREFIFTNTF